MIKFVMIIAWSVFLMSVDPSTFVAIILWSFLFGVGGRFCGIKVGWTLWGEAFPINRLVTLTGLLFLIAAGPIDAQTVQINPRAPRPSRSGGIVNLGLFPPILPQSALLMSNVSAGSGAWPNGVQWNARATSGFVTDPSGTIFLATTYTYPTTNTINGHSVTYGRVIDATHPPNGCSVIVPSSADRSALTGAQAVLAGIQYNASSGCWWFRVDLPATGTYTLLAALGDASFSNVQFGQVYDGVSSGTAIWTIANNVTTPANQWVDATGVTRTSPSDWVTNEASKQLTFTTTSLFLLLGGSGGDTTLSTFGIKTP